MKMKKFDKEIPDKYFKKADIVIVDDEDVEEIYPEIGEEQTLLSEDGHTKGNFEFNLIVCNEKTNNEPMTATQLGTHILNGKSVLDLREESGDSFADRASGL